MQPLHDPLGTQAASKSVTAQSLKAIERSDAVQESGAIQRSTREYMGLDIGTDRPCLWEAPEEVIRGDRVLSEVYDEIWEMGYRPHLFTGKPETEADGFDFNGVVRGEDVFVRIDHTRYDADAIWEHEKYHLLSAGDAELRSETRDALLERYGEAELLEKLGTYWEKYAGAYGLMNLQGEYDLSDPELMQILEEFLADAYAGKDTFRTGAADYQNTVREVASQRESRETTARGPPEESYSIGYDSRNRPFVTVEEDILEGVPREDWVRTVKDNLRKKFPNGVTVGNSEIEIDGTSRREMTWSGYSQWLQKAAGALGSDLLNDTPLIQNMGALFGIGDLSLPMPDIAQGIKRTAAAWEEGGGFSWEVARQLMGLAGDVMPGGRQAEKTFQGLDTALRGGRYSGYGENERLMYPVGDDPFTALKAALFGNSALEETGAYYASGEKALSVNQTKVYKSMVADGADRQEIYNAILDWRKTKGDDDLTNEEKARLCEAIVSNTSLDDREKLKFYRGLIGDSGESRARKLETLMGAGISWEGAIGAYAQYSEIQEREENMTAHQKATEFARWADQNYPGKQADTIKKQFKYYSIVPAEAGQYGKLTAAGLDIDTAYRLTEVLGKLEPEPGKETVSGLQKATAVVSAGLSEKEQLCALEAVMTENEYIKVQTGYGQGVTPAQYLEAKEAIAAADDGNGTTSQEEAKKAIKSMEGFTKEQKATLWQVQNKNWSAENNPFSTKVGKQVKKALEEAVSDSDTDVEGLKLPELK